MFGKFVLSFLIIAIIGCAQPKYISEAEVKDTNQQATESKASCEIKFTQSGHCLSWFWENKPSKNNEGSLIFKVYRLNVFDQTAIPMDAQQIPELVLWMPSMGHGSMPSVTTRLDVGTYRASKVFFIMPGEWDLKFQIKNGLDVVDEAQVQIIF